MNPIQKKILELAFADVGQKETPGNSGFENKKFLQQMYDAGWQKGWPWCAVWVEKIWGEAYKGSDKYAEVRKLITPSAVNTFTNFKAIGKTSNHPVPGALVVWRQGNGWSGHIGIVTKVGLDRNMFQTIEGNTNAAGGREGDVVAIKERRLLFVNSPKGLNLLGFVHPL
jgi:hypothetical protein